jgi:hypothetical protein
MVDLAIRNASVPAPRGWVGDLDWSLNWRVNLDHHYMAMLGYFDESGTHGPSSPSVIVGGFLATVEQADAYQRDLKLLLDEFGVQKFHAIALRRTEDDFKNWSHTTKARFNSRFLQLADQHLTCGLSAELSSETYRRIYRAGELAGTERLETQHGLCIRAALVSTVDFMKGRKADWPVNVIFERGLHQGDAHRIFSEVRDSLPKYDGLFGDIAFSNKTALPLAIADSLSYAVFRQSASSSKHPNPNFVVVGETDPPYSVHKIPLFRIIIDETTLIALRLGLWGVRSGRKALG